MRRTSQKRAAAYRSTLAGSSRRCFCLERFCTCIAPPPICGADSPFSVSPCISPGALSNLHFITEKNAPLAGGFRFFETPGARSRPDNSAYASRQACGVELVGCLCPVGMSEGSVGRFPEAAALDCLYRCFGARSGAHAPRHVPTSSRREPLSYAPQAISLRASVAHGLTA